MQQIKTTKQFNKPGAGLKSLQKNHDNKTKQKTKDQRRRRRSRFLSCDLRRDYRHDLFSNYKPLNFEAMQKLNEIYKIESDGRRKYYEPFESLTIIVRVPNTMIQQVIDAARANWCAYKIISRVPAYTVLPRYRKAGAELRIFGQARFIFNLLETIGVHQHIGHTYIANDWDWRFQAPAPNYTHRAYRRDASGVLRSKLIERHNIKQFRANGWHVVEI